VTLLPPAHSLSLSPCACRSRRCVKINAFLKQSLGFTNTSRLKGGIISYAREVRHAEGIPSTTSDPTLCTSLSLGKGSSSHSAAADVLPSDRSTFKGVNYVFDERIGSRITEDILGVCEMCGSPWDGFTNCRNSNCSVRFLQCPACSARYSGCCSLVAPSPPLLPHLCQSCQQSYREIVDKNAAYTPPRRADHIRSSPDLPPPLTHLSLRSYSKRRYSTVSSSPCQCLSAKGSPLCGALTQMRSLSSAPPPSPSQEMIEAYCER
jgi:hypothetical protein